MDVIDNLSQELVIPQSQLFEEIINNFMLSDQKITEINTVFRENEKWCIFYENIKDPSWPICKTSKDLDKLPSWIQEEIKNIFGYGQ